MGRGFFHDPFKTKKGPRAFGTAHDPYIYYYFSLLACYGIACKFLGKGTPTPNLNSVCSDYIIKKFIHKFFQ